MINCLKSLVMKIPKFKRESKDEHIRGYKAFKLDWTCRDFQYKVGETYELPDNKDPLICERGFHFCINLKDCFKYYPVGLGVRVAEVEAVGDVDKYSDHFNPRFNRMSFSKCCTNKIKILREIPLEDLEFIYDRCVVRERRNEKVYDLEEYINAIYYGLYDGIVALCNTEEKYDAENDVYYYDSTIDFIADVKLKEGEKTNERL